MTSKHAAGAVLGLLALPWLLPFTPGPSPNVVPWLVTAACALVAWLLAASAAPPLRLALAAGAAALVVLLRHSPTPLDRAAFAAAGALVLLGAGIARSHQGAAGRLGQSIAAAWLAAALLSALLALLQYFGAADALQPWVYASPLGEAVANLRQRNQLASLLAIGVAAVLWGPGALRLRWQLAAVALLALAAAATTSRTGLLHWLVLGGLAGLWSDAWRRRRLAVLAAGFAVYAAGALLLPLLLEAITGQAAQGLLHRVGGDAGCASRGVLWSNVLQLILQRPLAGWGWGELDYAHYAHLYPGERFCDILDNAHNLPLHLAVELGLPAALLVCAALAGLAWRGRPWAETEPARRLAWAVLAVLATHSLLEYPLWYGPLHLALCLALGLLSRSGGAVRPPRPLARGAVGALAAAALAYAAWDYLRVSQVYVEPERRIAWREQTLAHAGRSWLFAGQAAFAELTLSAVTRANAQQVRERAEWVLHYSPEPRVIERAIESATLTGRDDEAVAHLARYRAAFPAEYAAWRAARARQLPGLP